MKAFLYGTLLQLKINMRDKNILLTYYIVPLVFFVFIGGIFTSINESSRRTLTSAMCVFAITMGAFVGTPAAVAQNYRSDRKKASLTGGIPLYVPALNQFISGFMHLFFVGMIILLASPLIFKASWPADFGAFFIGILLYLTASLTIGVLLGLLIKSPSKLTMVSQLIFLPSLMLSGIMFDSALLPAAVRYIGYIFPATWGFKAASAPAISLNMLPLAGIMLICSALIIWRLHRIKAE